MSFFRHCLGPVVLSSALFVSTQKESRFIIISPRRSRERDLRDDNRLHMRYRKKRGEEKAVDEKEERAQTYQKQDLRVFLPQPQGGENVVEPIERPHDFLIRACFFCREKQSKTPPPKKNLKKTEVKKFSSRKRSQKTKKRHTRESSKKLSSSARLSLSRMM